MTPLVIWWRRGSATLALPAMLAIELVVLFSRSGWDHEWDWALSQAAGATVLLAPLVAGLVAHDRARRVEPTLAALARTTRRGQRAVGALALTAWASATAAWAGGSVVAAVLAGRGGAAATPDPWVFVEAPVLLLLATAVGLAVGTHLRSPLAGPAAAALLFLGRLVLGSLSLGLDGSLAAGGATGSLVSEERNPTHALALIALHAALALLALAVAISAERLLIAAAGVVAVGAAVALTVVSAHGAPYRWATGPEVCARGTVTVCGTDEAGYLLDASSTSLGDAVTRLAPSGLDLQTAYVLPHGGRVPADQGVLRASTDGIRDGRLPTSDVALTLAMPRLCRALFGDQPPQDLLADQRLVAEWLTAALHAPRVGPAPADVRAAFARLRGCAPMTNALR